MFKFKYNVNKMWSKMACLLCDQVSIECLIKCCLFAQSKSMKSKSTFRWKINIESQVEFVCEYLVNCVTKKIQKKYKKLEWKGKKREEMKLWANNVFGIVYPCLLKVYCSNKLLTLINWVVLELANLRWWTEERKVKRRVKRKKKIKMKIETLDDSRLSNILTVKCFYYCYKITTLIRLFSICW